MAHLTLAGLSGDGRRLLLVDDGGEEFTLDVDARLRAALRGEHARLGQLEITMESALRPRDIQARIRAGETPEAVAQAAQTTVERVLPYANPVLAERAHVADRAQRSSVRRRPGEPGARTLGEAVAAQLQPLDVSPDTVEWDAWRREDGRWVLTAQYAAAERSGTATFTFDQPGNYVTAEDPDAHWLVGEGVTDPAPAAGAARRSADELGRARARRRSALPGDQLTLGDDALELVNDGGGQQVAEPTTEPTTEPAGATDDSADEAAPGAAGTDEAATHRTDDPLRDTSAEEQPAPESEAGPETEPEPPARKKTARKRGRASVPSWDEIMFGGGKGD